MCVNLRTLCFPSSIMYEIASILILDFWSYGFILSLFVYKCAETIAIMFLFSSMLYGFVKRLYFGIFLGHTVRLPQLSCFYSERPCVVRIIKVLIIRINRSLPVPIDVLIPQFRSLSTLRCLI